MNRIELLQAIACMLNEADDQKLRQIYHFILHILK